MTIIKKLKPYSYKKIVITTETEKPLFYLGRELKEIDYTETTADKQFCDITFNDTNKTYLVNVLKLNPIEVKNGN